MIVPMKKYSFLVYHKEYEKFLSNLQELGVLHVIEKELDDSENEELREKYALLNNLNKAIKFLEKRAVEEPESSAETDGIKILHELNSMLQKTEEYHQKLAALRKDITALEPWGNFEWDSVKKLSEARITLRFFQAPQRKFEEEIIDNYYLEEINNLGGHIYFVLAQRNGEIIEIDAEEMHLPERTLDELLKQEQEILAIQEKTEEVFDLFAARHLDLLKTSKEKITGELSFDKVKLSTEHKAENKLMILEGWTPIDKEKDLEAYLEKTGVYYEGVAPKTEETPPIKLKNNRFAKLYEAIGELYTFPNYGELDLTPFFAPFYMLFFGFCLGDAGYGLLITLGTLYGLTKVKKRFKPLLKLGMFLGLATTFMGIVGGTFFGIMLHPENFEAGRTFSPWITKYQQFILSSDNLMQIALLLGYIQVVFGMFLKAANRVRLQGFKYAVSQFGWNLIVLVSLPAFALGKFEIISNADLSMKVAMISFIIGAVPAFFYNTPGKNPLLNLGVGVWDTYQVASGLLGDVLSYIRLFALGLSSAILGNVFNQLAMQSSEGVGGHFWYSCYDTDSCLWPRIKFLHGGAGFLCAPLAFDLCGVL
jgi:V/A-type H+-transporting ATPase subunit I